MRQDIVESLRQQMVRILPFPKPDGLSLEFGLARRQSASCISGPHETLIFFDLAQSLVLRRLLEMVRHERPYHEIASFLAACSGLAVAAEHQTVGDELLTSQLQALPEHHLHPRNLLEQFHLEMIQMVDQVLFDEAAALVDGFILAHECAHFVADQADGTFDRLRHDAQTYFRYAIESVCYENRSDFEVLATYWGQVPMDAPTLDRKRVTLAKRRAYYEANAGALIEEIACDSFGMAVASLRLRHAWLGEATEPEAILEGYARFVRSYHLIFTLTDLHQAMVRRAQLLVQNGHDDERPANVADMHLRKLAMGYALAHQAMIHLPREWWTQAGLQRVMEKIIPLVDAQKQALDATLVMPVTRAIQECRQALRMTNDDGPDPAAPRRPSGPDLYATFGSGYLAAVLDDAAVARLAAEAPQASLRRSQAERPAVLP